MRARLELEDGLVPDVVDVHDSPHVIVPASEVTLERGTGSASGTATRWCSSRAGAMPSEGQGEQAPTATAFEK